MKPINLPFKRKNSKKIQLISVLLYVNVDKESDCSLSAMQKYLFKTTILDQMSIQKKNVVYYKKINNIIEKGCPKYFTYIYSK